MANQLVNVYRATVYLKSQAAPVTAGYIPGDPRGVEVLAIAVTNAGALAVIQAQYTTDVLNIVGPVLVAANVLTALTGTPTIFEAPTEKKPPEEEEEHPVKPHRKAA